VCVDSQYSEPQRKVEDEEGIESSNEEDIEAGLRLCLKRGNKRNSLMRKGVLLGDSFGLRKYAGPRKTTHSLLSRTIFTCTP